MRKSNESQPGQARPAAYRLAQGLGVFSIALGIVELIWAGPLGRSLGMDGQEWIVRVCGAREFLTGVLILVSKDPAPWIWLRVIGDGLDAATLIWGYTRHPEDSRGIIIAFIAVTPLVIADIYCVIKLSSAAKKAFATGTDYRERSRIAGGT